MVWRAEFLIYARGGHWHRLWREHGKPNTSSPERYSRSIRAVRSSPVGSTLIPLFSFTLVAAELKAEGVGGADLVWQSVDEVVRKVVGDPPF